MTWQTGYPAGVDFARGYPLYRPHDGAAARLSRHHVDGALVLGSVALIPADIVTSLTQVPCAVIGPRASESALAGCGALIDTGVAGIHGGGSAIRMNDVPLPLRPLDAGLDPYADVVRGAGTGIAMRQIRIAGGTVRPGPEFDGEVRDVASTRAASWPTPAQRSDHRRVAWPSCRRRHPLHVASSVNLARRLTRGHERDPHGVDLLDTFSRSGRRPRPARSRRYRYAGLLHDGVDAAVAPITRLSHAELTTRRSTAVLRADGNDETAALIEGEREQARWSRRPRCRRGYAIKIVNPGGIEGWKRRPRTVRGLDAPLIQPRHALRHSRDPRAVGNAFGFTPTSTQNA